MFLGSALGVESLVAQIQAPTLFSGAEQLLHRLFGTLDLTLEGYNTSGEFSDLVVRWLTFEFLLVLKFLDLLSKGRKRTHAFVLHLQKLKEAALLKQGSPVLLVIWMVVVLQGLRPSYPLYTVQKLLKVMVQA